MRSQAVFSIAVNAEKQQTQTGVGLSAGPWSTLLRKVTMQSEWDTGFLERVVSLLSSLTRLQHVALNKATAVVTRGKRLVQVGRRKAARGTPRGADDKSLGADPRGRSSFAPRTARGSPARRGALQAGARRARRGTEPGVPLRGKSAEAPAPRGTSPGLCLAPTWGSPRHGRTARPRPDPAGRRPAARARLPAPSRPAPRPRAGC